MGDIWLDPPLGGCGVRGAPGTVAFLESVFASEVKLPPVCPALGSSDSRPRWASPRVCSLPLQLAAVGNMPHFLRHLTTQLHQQVPGGLVLWYDSVVRSGQLTWQDELNQHNR